jgi:uncharacterized protein (DUF934 family)
MSRPLIKQRALVEDSWQRVADDEALPATGPVLVSWGRWSAERDALALRAPADLGIVVNAAELPPEEIGADAARFGLIAFEFPAFADGRAFSHAALLRGRYGFKGELRATGRIIPDQLLFLERCGFDAFELPEPHDPARALALFNEFSAAYQRGRDNLPPVMLAREGRH